MLTEKRKESLKKYHNSLDEFKVRFPKGYRVILKDYSEKHGISMNQLFRDSVEKEIGKNTWVKVNNDYICTNCEMPALKKKKDDPPKLAFRTKYCPNCGFKMEQR